MWWNLWSEIGWYNTLLADITSVMDNICFPQTCDDEKKYHTCNTRIGIRGSAVQCTTDSSVWSPATWAAGVEIIIQWMWCIWISRMYLKLGIEENFPQTDVTFPAWIHPDVDYQWTATGFSNCTQWIPTRRCVYGSISKYIFGTV